MRKDRDPRKYSSVCSCHFRDGDKRNGPGIYERNQDKLLPEQRGPPPKKNKKYEEQVRKRERFYVR